MAYVATQVPEAYQPVVHLSARGLCSCVAIVHLGALFRCASAGHAWRASCDLDWQRRSPLKGAPTDVPIGLSSMGLSSKAAVQDTREGPPTAMRLPLAHITSHASGNRPEGAVRLLVLMGLAGLGMTAASIVLLHAPLLTTANGSSRPYLCLPWPLSPSRDHLLYLAEVAMLVAMLFASPVGRACIRDQIRKDGSVLSSRIPVEAAEASRPIPGGSPVYVLF